ncbi:hypothetical protein [Flocculibacter collagenilyticus]|uniref:hypothetical protein n=1 Tax=Flocculibacter collagenilyticus TaxID=2744479 RepID=UPI0018F7933C|nr:hypothetical protein [Flocculibacter collagenilyticus]
MNFNQLSIFTIAFYVGLVAVGVGAIISFINWTIWGGGLPSYPFFLFPGNLVLSLFTEEIDFWPKLILQLTGQFCVVAMATLVVAKLFRKCRL